MPKLTRRPRPTLNICDDLTLRHLDLMIKEVGKSDSAAAELLEDPKAFFENRGFSVPRRANVSTKPLEKLHDAINQQNRNRIFSHIGKGRARCKTIVIE